MARSPTEVVGLFGGRDALSESIPGLKPKAVFMWEPRGAVPGKWHIRLLRLAREEGVPLTEDDLLPELSTTRRMAG